MGTVTREATFEQNEFGNAEGVGCEIAPTLKEILRLAGSSTLPPGKSDVRVKRAAFGLETDLLAHSFDLGGKHGNRRLGNDTRPQGTTAPLLEAADAGDFEFKRGSADSGQSSVEIVCHGSFDVADKAKRQMELLLALPSKVGALIHGVDEQVADRLRWANGDKQSVHCLTAGPPRRRRIER